MTPDQEKALRAELAGANAALAKSEEFREDYLIEVCQLRTALAAAQGVIDAAVAYRKAYVGSGPLDYGKVQLAERTLIYAARRASTLAALNTSGKPGGEAQAPGFVGTAVPPGFAVVAVSSDGSGTLSICAAGFTTVRACIGCGVLIAGGPTRCIGCATRAPAPPEGHPAPEGDAETCAPEDHTCPEEGCTLKMGHAEPCDTRLPWEIEESTASTPAPGAGEQRKGEE